MVEKTSTAAKTIDVARLKELEAKLGAYKSTLTEIYEQYDQKIEELSLIRRMGDAFRSTISLKALLKSLLETVAHEVMVDRLALLMNEENLPAGVMLLRSTYFSSEEKFTFYEPQQAMLWPLSTLAPLIGNDKLTNPLTIMEAEAGYDPLGQVGDQVRSLIFLPLLAQDRLLGLLVLSRPGTQPFRQEDERMLAIMADQASAALANVLLFDDLSRVNLRLTKSEERARQISNYLQRSLENANDAIFTLNAKGRITYANLKAEQWGWTKSELLGKEFRSLLADSTELSDWRLGGSPPADQIFEAILINSVGEKRDILLSISKVDREAVNIAETDLAEAGAAGESWMMMVNDMTERKQLERQLLHSEKLASIGLLAAGVAHEVGNPLSAISGYAQILAAGGSSPQENEEYLSAILNQTTRIQKILRELLDYSRPSQGLKEEIDLAEAIPKILNMLTSQRSFAQVKVHYKLDKMNAPHLVLLDRDHLAQVVVIIAMNAAQAMKEGGNFTVSLAKEPGFIILRFQDDGPGMPPEIRDRVFDPFFTTKSPGEGTGLGLAICQRIVDSYHGQIELESELGLGSTFTIYWPEPLATNFS